MADASHHPTGPTGQCNVRGIKNSSIPHPVAAKTAPGLESPLPSVTRIWSFVLMCWQTLLVEAAECCAYLRLVVRSPTSTGICTISTNGHWSSLPRWWSFRVRPTPLCQYPAYLQSIITGCPNYASHIVSKRHCVARCDFLLFKCFIKFIAIDSPVVCYDLLKYQ